jgi:hypothetical protein
MQLEDYVYSVIKNNKQKLKWLTIVSILISHMQLKAYALIVIIVNLLVVKKHFYVNTLMNLIKY